MSSGLRAARVLVVLMSVGWLLAGCDSLDEGDDVVSVRAALDVGTAVRTVTLPPEIDCTTGSFSHIAISVVAVPAGNLGVTGLDNKRLLGTSCRNNPAGGTIYFIDPGSADTSETTVTGTIAHQLDVDFVPPNGWGALAYRGDVQPHDIIACSNPATDTDPHSVYSINLLTGHATKLFDGSTPTPGRPYCDGLAWDPGSDTYYMGSDISDTISHYAYDGVTTTLLDTLPVPAPCGVDETDQGPSGKSGLVVVGPDLLVACDGLQTIFEISKKDGSLVRTYTSGASRAEDLECDATTFGPDVPVAWTKDAFLPQFLSFVVPPGTCGLCRSTHRPDLNNDLSAAERADLAALELEYLTANNASTLQRGAVVAEHRVSINAWHGAPQFFPGHRGYIGEFEFWLANVKNRPEFVPLPKWNPANEIPLEFQGTDTLACQDSTQLPPVTGAGNCGGFTTTNINAPLPAAFVFSGPTTGLCSFATVQDVQNGGLEGGYHGGTVHCGIGGTMCDVTVSPSSLIFLPWHAFVDDVAYEYECSCKGSCAVCTDVFTPFAPVTSPLMAQNRNGSGHGHAGDDDHDHPGHAPDPGHGHGHDNGHGNGNNGNGNGNGGGSTPPPQQTSTVGFWFWFEDPVVPPDVTPPFVTDHAGFFLRGDVRGRPRLVPGMVGQALELDGRDDAVIVEDPAAGDVGTMDFTLDAWVKTSEAGFQPIVSKVHDQGRDDRDVGYVLFLKDGRLGLFLGTSSRRGVVIPQDSGDAGPPIPSVSDGAWHHVAAIVDRARVGQSKLMVDGRVIMLFDATPFADDASSHARLRIGQLDVEETPALRRHHHACLHHKHHHFHDNDGRAFFEGQLDEIDLFRAALSADQVASIFVAGSAGKFGSLGNLPTSAGEPPCITVLGQRIAVLPPASAAPLQALYVQLQTAIAQGRRGQARQITRQIANQAEAGFDRTYNTVQFHAVTSIADACLDVPPLGGKP